jgi:hypothetical protein
VKTTLYFQRIGWGNFAYAWLLSLRHRVVAWKIELLPRLLARRFARFEAYDLFSRDEKLRLQGLFRPVASDIIAASGAAQALHRHVERPARQQYLARHGIAWADPGVIYMAYRIARSRDIPSLPPAL